MDYLYHLKNNFIHKLVLFFIIILCANIVQASFLYQQSDTLKYQFKDQDTYNYDEPEKSPLYLESPSNIKDTVEYDPNTNEYIISKIIGEHEYRPSKRMTLEEYQEYQFEQSLRNYWRQRAKGENIETQSGLFPNLRLGGEADDKKGYRPQDYGYDWDQAGGCKNDRPEDF